MAACPRPRQLANTSDVEASYKQAKLSKISRRSPKSRAISRVSRRVGLGVATIVFLVVLTSETHPRETHYDPSVSHSVCNDQEACTRRMPAGRRKRKRPEGDYARLAGGR